jgi:hypothetical protein
VTFPPQDWQYPQVQYPQVPSPYGPGPVADPEQPIAMRRAVAFMYAGAAISFVSAVVGGAHAFSVVRSGWFGPGNGTAMLVLAVISGLVPCGLWLWMAWKAGAGRDWARVLSAIFFGCLSLQVIPTMILLRSPGIAGVSDIAQWLVGLVALVLLSRRECGQFFAMTRHARATRGSAPPGYWQQPPPR